MDGGLNSSSSFSSTSSLGSSMGMISPKSPPAGSLDLYGKRRQLVKVQLLEREIGFLQDELKSIDGIQAASGCCKDLDDFIRAKTDPLVVLNEEASKSNHWWKRFRCRVKFCCCIPTTCCFTSCCSCFRCSIPKNILCCCSRKSTCKSCCSFPKLSCSCSCCAPKCCCLGSSPCCSCKCETARSCCFSCEKTCSRTCCCSCL